MSVVEGYNFRKDMSRMLAYSMIFKRNATQCILAYGIRRSVSVCMRVCVYVCIRPFERLIGGPQENG